MTSVWQPLAKSLTRVNAVAMVNTARKTTTSGKVTMLFTGTPGVSSHSLCLYLYLCLCLCLCLCLSLFINIPNTSPSPPSFMQAQVNMNGPSSYYLIANANYTSSRACNTHTEFALANSMQGGLLTTTFYPQSPRIHSVHNEWDEYCFDVLSQAFMCVLFVACHLLQCLL